MTRTSGGALFYRSSGENFDNSWYAVYVPNTKTWFAPFIVSDGSYGTESTTQTGKKIVWTGTGYFADSGKTLPIRDTNVNRLQHVCRCGRSSIRRRLENGVQRDLHENLGQRYDGTHHHSENGSKQNIGLSERTRSMPEISRALPAYVVAVAILVAIGLWAVRIEAQGLPTTRDLAVRPDFAEPVMLSSKDGVLEVTLTPRQSTAQSRHRRQARQEHAALRLFGAARNRVRRPDVGRPPVSRADAASRTGRKADRSHQQRAAQPDDPRLLRPEVHAQGPDRCRCTRR